MRKVVMLDDLDKTSEAVETLPIFFEGWTYVLDLSAENAAWVRETLKPLLDAAHDRYRGHTPPGKRAKTTAPTVTDALIAPVPQKRSRSNKSAEPALMEDGRTANYYSLTSEERADLRKWAIGNGHNSGRGVIPNNVIALWLESKGAA